MNERFERFKRKHQSGPHTEFPKSFSENAEGSPLFEIFKDICGIMSNLGEQKGESEMYNLAIRLYNKHFAMKKEVWELGAFIGHLMTIMCWLKEKASAQSGSSTGSEKSKS